VKIEALENYSKLFSQKGETLVFARTLGKYESELQIPFFRVNRSIILNLNFCHFNYDHVVMTDGSRVMISRRRRLQVMLAFEKVNKF
jgi:DNA-binding LytR/AlgR family response regulator